MAYDRYVVISNPLEAAMQVTKKRAMGMIAITYVLSLFWSLPPFFGWGAYIPEGFQVNKIILDLLCHSCLIKIGLHNRWYKNKIETLGDFKKLAAKKKKTSKIMKNLP